jgi:hypothetical protein
MLTWIGHPNFKASLLVHTVFDLKTGEVYLLVYIKTVVTRNSTEQGSSCFLTKYNTHSYTVCNL